MSMAAILVMWRALSGWIFISLYLQAYIQNLAEDGPVVTEKQLYFLFVNDLGQRPRNDLDLQYVYLH